MNQIVSNEAKVKEKHSSTFNVFQVQVKNHPGYQTKTYWSKTLLNTYHVEAGSTASTALCVDMFLLVITTC